MRLALAQINPTVGAIDANADLILAFVARAAGQRADLVVFPELALTGYPPKDLLLQEGFVAAASEAAKRIAREAPKGLTVVFGLPLPADETKAGTRVANSLLAYRDGELLAYYDKRLLPTYDVFDEDRYFTPGSRPVVIDVAGAHVGLSICEDLWRGHDVGFSDRYADCPDPVEQLCAVQPDGRPGAGLIVNPSASPFVLGKGARHRQLLADHAKRHNVFVAAVNQVGGNDELIFDGHAGVYNPAGDLIAASLGFAEDLLLIDIPASAPPIADPLLAAADEELVYRTLVLGIRDYCRKTGFKTCVLGLSGGIDSAVCAVLAAAAVGPVNVLGLSMPSRYSSDGSKSDATALAAAIGMPIETIPIEAAFGSLTAALKPLFAGKGEDVTEENLQSRIRGTLLMGASNKFNRLLLTTGNKSELAVGYCTLYGDMNGGLAVLSDVTKAMVYRLARWMNANPALLGITGLTRPPIPDASITKPPSAELRHNQTDQDSLPPYEVLDEIIDRYVERRQSPAHITADTGFDPAVVKRIARLIDLAEFKRKQAPIGLKVTGTAFGSGRRMPIAQGWRG